MKAAAILVLTIAAFSLSACEYLGGKSLSGNPYHSPYVGEAGGAYDPAANPPKDIGQVAYNPNQPLTNNLPADATLPPPVAPNSVAAAPLAAPMGNPAIRPRTP